MKKHKNFDGTNIIVHSPSSLYEETRNGIKYLAKVALCNGKRNVRTSLNHKQITCPDCRKDIA